MPRGTAKVSQYVYIPSFIGTTFTISTTNRSCDITVSFGTVSSALDSLPDVKKLVNLCPCHEALDTLRALKPQQLPHNPQIYSLQYGVPAL